MGRQSLALTISHPGPRGKADRVHAAGTVRYGYRADAAQAERPAFFRREVRTLAPLVMLWLCSGGGLSWYSDSTFTSKVTLDALINSVTKGGEGNHLDVLLVGEQGGKILLK
jgi:hypothetical protein